jgi:mono/diheme cytochrome c family protein
MDIFCGESAPKRSALRFVRGTFVVVVAVVLFLAGFHAAAQTSRSGAKTPAVSADTVQNGKKIFTAQRCFQCHGVAGQGGIAPGVAGPRISPPPVSLPDFVALVREPRGQMPPYSAAQVSDAELAEVYAFLKPKPSNQAEEKSAGGSSGGNLQNGKALYINYGCYNCHGRYAQGSTATGPRLNPMQVSLDDLIKYVRHPSGEMPPYTAKVVSDGELADIFAFLKSLPAPPKVEGIPLLK